MIVLLDCWRHFCCNIWMFFFFFSADWQLLSMCYLVSSNLRVDFFTDLRWSGSFLGRIFKIYFLCQLLNLYLLWLRDLSIPWINERNRQSMLRREKTASSLQRSQKYLSWIYSSIENCWSTNLTRTVLFWKFRKRSIYLYEWE